MNEHPTIDLEKLKRIKAGDLQAFNEMMLFYERAIFNHLYRLTGSKDDAADLAQDTFFKVYRFRDRIDVTKNFKSWLYKIATNTAYDWLEKKGKFSQIPLTDEDGETKETELPYYRIDEAMKVDIAEAVSKLKPEYQTVIHLYYSQGFGYEEIADIMKLPLGTVKTMLHRAKKVLAEKLKNYGTATETT